MAHELRVPAPDELAEFMRPVLATFGDPEPSEDHIADEGALWEPERGLGVVDGHRWVGVAGAFTLELSVPGGASVPVAGVTMVGVQATHRRRGILATLMERQLDDVAERGEPLAILTASETGIYGRFGYGLAASMARYEIETSRSRFEVPVEEDGRLTTLRRDEIVEPLAAAYEAGRRRRAGPILRRRAWWELHQRDRERWREGASAMYWVLHTDAGGNPDGYVGYRIQDRWPDRVADSVVMVEDLWGATDQVEAVLWRYLLDIDLAGWVHALNRPVDDPIRWRLADNRRLRTRAISDWLWARVIDVPAALQARTYSAAGSVVMEVVDDFRPASGGRFRLEVDELGRATCEPTSEAAELTLGGRDLSAAYLGGVAVRTLVAAGRVDEHAVGAAGRADALFATHPAPFCGTMF